MPGKEENDKDCGCLFSVLIASYNNGKYIAQSIQSVLNQAYKHWEIIIVDDGSTDDSVAIIKDFLSDKRISLFLNPENRGCGFTKRRCVELAGGDICGFLDPDDTLTPDALEVMVRLHAQNPQSALCYGTHYVCDEFMNPEYIPAQIRRLPEGIKYLDLADGSISQFASFKRSYYVLTPGIDPVLPKAVDQDLYYKLEEAGEVTFVNRPLYHYRIHAGGISSGQNVALAGYWNMYVRERAYVRRIGREGDPKEKRRLQSRYHYIAGLNGLTERNKGKFLKHSLAFLKMSGPGINTLKYIRRVLLTRFNRRSIGQLTKPS